MPFEKVDPKPDFPALERQMLALWDRIGAFELLKAKNRGKARWSFLDGPITANNPMGVHHAWGRTYKDAYNRYFAMTGHELRYQQGFDCQGLWVEVEVEKEKKLQNKRDIENLVPGDTEASIAQFVQACKDRVDRFARVQTDQSIRLGYWMDWDRDEDWARPPDERKSYFTMSEENNYTIWSFLKKCHHKGLIYRGYDSMPWCGRCGVGLSEMEMKEGYRLVEHKAVFVKLPLKGRPGENLLIWTTTPWTLTANVGAAVNPDLTYLKVKLKGEVHFLAKGTFKLNRMESSADEEAEEPSANTARATKRRDWLEGVPHLSTIEQHFKAKAGKEGYEVVGEVKGSEMIGWEYVGPFDDVPAQQHPGGFPEEVARLMEKRHALLQEEYDLDPRTAAVQQPQLDSMLKAARESHRVISGGADVTETEGTGIVHTAPGCGQIDFQWGKDNGLPPVAPIDDSGTFHSGFGDLTGRSAADPATAEAIFEYLKRKELLFATERYVHRYPHCWRCKTELLYRLVDEWFIGMGPRNSEEGFRGEIMKVVKRVTFLPESLNGRAREHNWLWNMGDWMISKKRYWGLALPIWVDEKDPTQFEVIGSRAELKERAVEGWPEFDGHSPHRPWVDKVKIRNLKTGNLMSRIPDVGNPWLDAGIVAFSTMKYNTDRAYWERWYPADFITESFPGQFRNWFYALLAMSTMMSDGKEPFKTLLGHGLVRDEQGREMHKSLGNSIEFNQAAEEMGADAMRWLYCRANPAANLNFGTGPVNEVRAKFIIKLWNCYSFFCNYARLDGFDPTAPALPVAERPDMDRWILSDLQGLIITARKSFEGYNVMAFCLEAERFVDESLSNWYIRRNRGRLQSSVEELDATGLRDKRAAHQTLYTALTTLCKLFAPVVPFLSEAMWQNLRTDRDPKSVHLCDYPGPDPALVDEQLSADMDALLALVTLGGAARNVAKIKVRQPLAEVRISTESVAVGRAVNRFREQIREELNVKAVTLHDPARDGQRPALLTASARLNKKTAAAKLGPKLKDAERWLAAEDAVALAGRLRNGPVEVLGVALAPADIAIEYKAAENGWAGVAGKDTQLVVDARITDDLAREGMARDVIRQVQEHRKECGLSMEDRIELYLGTDSETLRAAIDAHRDHIAAETLSVAWATAPTGEQKDVSIEGQGLKIALRKVG